MIVEVDIWRGYEAAKAEFTRQLFGEVLAETKGNKSSAARLLKIHRNTLVSILTRNGIYAPRKGQGRWKRSTAEQRHAVMAKVRGR